MFNFIHIHERNNCLLEYFVLIVSGEHQILFKSLLKILLILVDFNIQVVIQNNRFVYYKKLIYIHIKFNNFSIKMY